MFVVYLLRGAVLALPFPPMSPQYVAIAVDLDAPENTAAVQQLDDGEHIDAFLAPWCGLYDWLLAKHEEEGCAIDARLLSFALGLRHANARDTTTDSSSGPQDLVRTEKDGTPSRTRGAAMPVPLPSMEDPREAATDVGEGVSRSDSVRTGTLGAMTQQSIQAAALEFAKAVHLQEEKAAPQPPSDTTMTGADAEGNTLVGGVGSAIARFVVDRDVGTFLLGCVIGFGAGALLRAFKR
jgi:hypothetical protein